MRLSAIFTSLLLGVLLSGCAPVFDRSIMDAGVRNVPLSAVRADPEAFKGRLFILGGMIISTKLTAEGALIEALAVPVDSRGHLKYDAGYGGRFLAFYPRERGMLDPVIYAKGREITAAAGFREIRTGMIDEMEYAYPVFEIRQLHLWPERTAYPYYGYPYYYPFAPSAYYRYPYWYYDPWLYPGWGRPWPPPYP